MSLCRMHYGSCTSHVFPSNSFPCLPRSFSEPHKRQVRSGQDTMHPGCTSSDRFFSILLTAGATDISPTAIIIFAKAESRLKNQESHNPNALAKKNTHCSGWNGPGCTVLKLNFPPKCYLSLYISYGLITVNTITLPLLCNAYANTSFASTPDNSGRASKPQSWL